MPPSTATVAHAQSASLKRDTPFIGLVSLVIHTLSLSLPLALLQIYDRILPAQALGTAGFLVAGVALALVLEAVLRYGRSVLFSNIAARYEAQTTMAALTRLQQADVAEVERRGTARISDALRSICQVRDFWSGQAGMALYELPFVLVYLALVGYLAGWLVVVPLGLFVLAWAMAAVLHHDVEKATQALEASADRRHALSWAVFDGLAYLKAIGAEGRIAAIWRRLNDYYLAQNAALETRMAWLRENAAAFGQLSTVLVVTFGAMEVVSGQLTTGALAACSMLAGRSIGPAMASLGYWSQIARTRDAQARVDDLLSLPVNGALGSGIASAEIHLGALRIEAPTLLSKPLDIAPGEVVHLGGADTASITHLFAVVAGLEADPSVKVHLDGRDYRAYTEAGLRQHMALVTRHLALVPGSILDNLTLYDARFHAQAHHWSEVLGLQPFVNKLHSGLLTDVGPGTAEQLDEGIYQRMALVRALAREPLVLLLDHAAIGIDIDGVKRLAEVLRQMQGKTTVLIATNIEALQQACTRSVEVQA